MPNFLVMYKSERTEMTSREYYDKKYSKEQLKELFELSEPIKDSYERNEEGFEVKNSIMNNSFFCVKEEATKEFFKNSIRIPKSGATNKKFVESFIDTIDVETIYVGEKPMTLMKVRLINGWVFTESTTCVNPEDYNEEMGREILMRRVNEKLFELTGFLLQTLKMMGE